MVRKLPVRTLGQILFTIAAGGFGEARPDVSQSIVALQAQRLWPCINIPNIRLNGATPVVQVVLGVQRAHALVKAIEHFRPRAKFLGQLLSIRRQARALAQ